MKYVEFKEICESLTKHQSIPYAMKRNWYTRKEEPHEFDEGYFFVSDLVGGASGGNCWGDDPRAFIADDFNYSVIDHYVTDLLEKVNPKITFIQFRKLENRLKDVIKDGSYSESEYYGNYNDYRYEALKFDDIYSIMKELELFE